MKKRLISFLIALCLLVAVPLSAIYKYNPFTRKLDYYEPGLNPDGARYYGDTDVDTTWRTIRDGTKLSFQRRETGTYVEKGYFDATSFHSANIYVGNVHLEEEHGCLATEDFHAHGAPPVAGYFKFAQGTTPAVHKEAGHSILWVDSNDKLYLEKPDGTDVEIVFAAVAEYLQASLATDQNNFSTGTDVKFDTVDIFSGTGISLDTSTGKFTLSAGKTYRLTSGVRFEYTSAAKIGFAWYNITGSDEISVRGRMMNMSEAGDYSTLPVMQAIITPSVETEVTVRCVWEGDGVEDVNGGHAWAIIEVIAGNALYSDVWELSGADIYYNSGNVGVGEISPDERLHITGNSATIKLEDDGGNYGRLKIGNTWLTLEVDPDGTELSSAFIFKGDGNEIMRINGWDKKINIPGIYDETDASAANVFVASDGSLRRSTSSRKIKKDIVENVDPNWALQFKPVTFKAKADDSEHMGFIAEDMRDVDSRLATDGDLPGLELNAIIAALTATVQEQQRQIEEIKAKIW